MIYIAAPYTSRKTGALSAFLEEEWRARAAARYAAILFARWEVVYSPTAMGHAMRLAHPGMPRTWDSFRKQSLEMVERADELQILMLPGWSSSVGVHEETIRANEVGIPIVPVVPPPVCIEWKYEDRSYDIITTDGDDTYEVAI